jgi:hypothetical protein
MSAPVTLGEQPAQRRPRWAAAVAIVAILFGFVTVIVGGPQLRISSLVLRKSLFVGTHCTEAM